jgi:rfaE bifunctional protein nucleotidyltransferase chain/domain
MRSSLKVRPLEQVARIAESARARGRTVALCNGVFELLHVGHVRYLEGARELADVVVVAVNGDDSARALKGAGRPVVPAVERAELVAAVWCVDAVLVFDEPDVRELLRAIRPDFHVKGTDYTPETVPERDVAAEVGARVVIAGDPKKHSASDLLRRLRTP